MLYLTNASEESVFEELWKYFVEKYFSNDLTYLENFSVRANDFLFYKLIIIGLCLGLIAASVCNLYNKRFVGDFVRRIIREGSLDKDNAKTLEELGYLNKPTIGWLIKSGGSLSRWVRCAEEDEFLASVEAKRLEFEEKHKDDPKKPSFKEPQFKRDVKTMHFYLPEEKRIAAEIRFDPKGANLGGVILVSVLSIALCLVLCYMLSDIIKLFDNFISVMGKDK